MNRSFEMRIWGGAFAFMALTLLLWLLHDIPLDGGKLLGISTGWIAAFGLAVYRVHKARSDYVLPTAVGRVIDVIGMIAQLSILSMAGALASYVVAQHTSGYVDEYLAHVDQMMGFDWVALYNFVTSNAGVQYVSQLSYKSIFLTPTLVLLALGAAGMSEHGRKFLFAYAIALIVTVLLFYFFPARAAVAHHLGDAAPYVPGSGALHLPVFEALRSGAIEPVDPNGLAGMITFPSFHASAAILFIWAAWPLKMLRWPILLINIAMLMATPIEGAHYLIDVIGGVVVAGLSIAVVVSGRVRLSYPARTAPDMVPST